MSCVPRGKFTFWNTLYIILSKLIHTLCLFIKRLQHAHSTFLLLTVPPNSSVSLRATCKDLPRILPPKNQSASSSFKYFLPELPWRLNGQDYLLAMQETQVQSLVWEDPLEKRMATHIQHSCPENPMDGGALQATVHGVAKSQTCLSDSPSSLHFHTVTTSAYKIPHKRTSF